MFPEDTGVIPLPAWDGREPEVSNPFDGGPHRGVDMMYRAAEKDPAYSTATPTDGRNRTKRYYMPDGMTALATADGSVWRTGVDSHGSWVRLAHEGGKWNTYYRHLKDLLVKEGDAIVAGQQLGTIWFDPSDSEKVKHLHVELESWSGGKGTKVDPAKYMNAWRVMSPSGIVIRDRWNGLSASSEKKKGSGSWLWLLIAAAVMRGQSSSRR